MDRITHNALIVQNAGCKYLMIVLLSSWQSLHSFS